MSYRFPEGMDEAPETEALLRLIPVYVRKSRDDRQHFNSHESVRF